MNKKLLICGAIVAGLVLVACSKKENASEPQEQQAQSEQTAQNAASEQFHPLNNNEQTAPVATPAPEPKVEVEHQETNNTTTEIRRETRPAQPAATDDSDAHAATETPVKDKTPAKDPSDDTPVKAAKSDAPKKSSSGKLSEDDAVAAAIAAATPALKN
ncbi:hypothetical protein [Acinetobacter sp. MD2(2019)]|uniref:hypothetical protein n=1 Tax=Acinetobacter sp. MD2(2019) TaxID=2605273 RepID=UPI002D1EF674|nr:hypothetical protein [Acinetobacter sp. MD2(2019)]MEB3752969.1 hypothetical protein [Acinetobacter sp. MD2(2019)]